MAVLLFSATLLALQSRRTHRLQVGDGDGDSGGVMLQIGVAELNEAAARESRNSTRTSGRLSIIHPHNASVLSTNEVGTTLRVRAVLTLPHEHGAVAPLLHRSGSGAICVRINGHDAGCRSAIDLADSFAVRTRGLLRIHNGNFWHSLSLSLAVEQWHFEGSVLFHVSRAAGRGQDQCAGQDAQIGLEHPRLALFSTFMEGAEHSVGAPPPSLTSGTAGTTHTTFFGACFDRFPHACDARAAAASFCVDHSTSIDFRALLLGRRSWTTAHAPAYLDNAVGIAAADAVHVMLPITPGQVPPTIPALCMLCMLHSFKARAAAAARDRQYGALQEWVWPPAIRLPPQLLPQAKSGVVIPRVLHRIWLGPQPQPRRYAAFEAEWRRHHPPPRWRVVTWRDRDLSGLPLSKAGRALLAPGSIVDPRARADVLRLELMFHLGGCYADADVEPLRSLDIVLEQAQRIARTKQLRSLAIAALEAPDVVGNAFLCSTPGATYFGRLLAALPAWLARHDNLWLQDRRRQHTDSDSVDSGVHAPHRATWRRTGPYFLSRAATAVGDDILLLPRLSFYERHFSQSGASALIVGMQTLGRHHWGWSSVAGSAARLLLPSIGSRTRLRVRVPSVWVELTVEVPLVTQLNTTSLLGGSKAVLAVVRNWQVCAHVQRGKRLLNCSGNHSFCNGDTASIHADKTTAFLTCKRLDLEQPVLLQNNSGRGLDTVEHQVWQWHLRIALGSQFCSRPLEKQSKTTHCDSMRLMTEISLFDGSGFEACESRHPWFDMPSSPRM